MELLGGVCLRLILEWIMTRNEWRIIGPFVGIIAGAVLILSFTTKENIFHVSDQQGVTIEELQRERSSLGWDEIDLERFERKARDQNLSSEDVKKLKIEIQKHGFSIEDGKVVRKDR